MEPAVARKTKKQLTGFELRKENINMPKKIASSEYLSKTESRKAPNLVSPPCSLAIEPSIASNNPKPSTIKPPVNNFPFAMNQAARKFPRTPKMVIISGDIPFEFKNEAIEFNSLPNTFLKKSVNFISLVEVCYANQIANTLQVPGNHFHPGGLPSPYLPLQTDQQYHVLPVHPSAGQRAENQYVIFAVTWKLMPGLLF